MAEDSDIEDVLAIPDPEPDEGRDDGDQLQQQTGPAQASSGKRLVLTEDMLIRNPQVRLPLQSAGDDRLQAGGNDAGSELQARGLSTAELEAIVRDAVAEVSARLQSELPRLLEEAIKRRLPPTDESEMR